MDVSEGGIRREKMNADISYLDSLSVSIYADGADVKAIKSRCEDHWIKGFTTNPTLMRNAGVVDYEEFCREALEIVGERSLSLEVFADDVEQMERQARKVASWGSNIFVKIPVTTTRGETTAKLVQRLSEEGVQLNVTALTTSEQVAEVAGALRGGCDSIISVFAGRVADTGRDPVLMMQACLAAMADAPRAKLLWASPREVLNLVQAEAVGCHIITMTDDLLAKLAGIGKDLDRLSLETVQMFRRDALASAFEL